MRESRKEQRKPMRSRIVPLSVATAASLAVLGAGAARSAAAPPVPAPEARGFEAGFEKDSAVLRSGTASLRCTNAEGSEKRGVEFDYALNQTRPVTVLVTGWSRAQGVSGTPNADYSLYCDLTYDDGSHAYGYASSFETGTHDWQRRRITITPDRPIRSLQVYGLLRGGHVGTAWFADFAVTPLAGVGVFDSQPLTAPRLPQSAASGWFVRDVEAGGALIPLAPGGKPANGLALSAVRTDHNGRVLHASLSGDGSRTRAITLYYVERFGEGATKPPVWWQALRETEAKADTEESNAVTAGDVGATGTQTKYPFGCVTTGSAGRALAIPPDLGPRIARIGYHPGAHLLYVAFDIALMPGRGPAPVAVARYAVAPEWGMRDAARAYYALFPEYYARRTKVEGIWMPFTDPSTIPHVEDFHIGWHEGDNSVATDDKRGILSLRYAEPMSYWMPMDPQEKRDYSTAFAKLQRIASGAEIPKSDPEQQRRQAIATLVSGSRAADGKLNVQFQDAPWCNGAVWTLNPNPHMPTGAQGWNKARVNYDLADANKRYGRSISNGYQGGILDGEYLDSTESWAHVLDYGAESLKWSPAPPTFAAETFRPTIPTWFSVWEYMDWLRADLRQRGKLLMGNSTPWSIDAFAPLLDAAGTETSWLGGDGSFQPESDAFMCWRRTLCGQKPYLLLLNLDFDKFPASYVEGYFRRCLFYGIFPSFFSVNAAEHPYWENAKLYERDRPTFKKYLPILQTLAAAGWEPVTNARSGDPSVCVERFGTHYLTVWNTAKEQRPVTLTLDRSLTGGKPLRAAADLLGGSQPVVAPEPNGEARVTFTLPPDGVAALRLGAAPAIAAR